MNNGQGAEDERTAVGFVLCGDIPSFPCCRSKLWGPISKVFVFAGCDR